MNTESGVQETSTHEQTQKQQVMLLPPQGKQNGSAAAASAAAAVKHVTKLSTSSPEAIKVASEITPTRLANLLIKKGPLPIRLITSQLAVEVPGFDLLSLSKQRRLIMAAMEAGDSENNVVFEKIGWGQWAVRRKDSDYIVTEGSNTDDKARISVHELKEKAKLGWSKKEPKKELALSSRRDSISNGKHNLHNVSVPGEALDGGSGEPVDSESDDEDEATPFSDEEELNKLRMARFGTAEVDDNAIAEDSDEDDMDTAEDGLFQFDHDDSRNERRWKKLPPVLFANRVPLKVLPPPHLLGSRRKLSLSAGANSVTKSAHMGYSNRHQLFSRLRLNSIENLDNYIVSSGRGLLISVSSPPPPSGSVLSVSPIGSWSASTNHLHPGTFNVSAENFGNTIGGRRKSSFNESSIRSTLLSSLPKNTANGANGTKTTKQEASDTDEEDWATIGAESLRKHSAGSLTTPGKEDSLRSEEKRAARALVDLMSI